MNENYIKVRSEAKSDASNVKSTTLVADETGLRLYHAVSGSGILAKDRVWTLVLPNGNARTKVTENSIGVYNATSSGTEQLKWKLIVPDGSHTLPEQAFKTISTEQPIEKTETSSAITIGHHEYLTDRVMVGDNTNLTPKFGDTIKIPNLMIEEYGHSTDASDRSITIPSSSATSSANGLMKKEDYKFLHGGASAYVTLLMPSSETYVEISEDNEYYNSTYGCFIPFTVNGHAEYPDSDIAVMASESPYIRINVPGIYRISGAVELSAGANPTYPSRKDVFIVYGNTVDLNDNHELLHITDCGDGVGGVSIGSKIAHFGEGVIVKLGVRTNVITQTHGGNISVKRGYPTYLDFELLKPDALYV